MTNKSLVEGQKKQSSRDRIIDFFISGDVILNADEERMMMRWMFVDGLIRSKKFKREDIIRMTVEKFAVSKFTADADIAQAHHVFGRTRSLNKNYLLSHIIDDIGLQIERMKTSFAKGSEQALAKLYMAYIKAVNSLPDDADPLRMPPAQIIFKMFDPDKLKVGMTPDEAREKAMEFIRKQAEDAEFEDITGEGEE